MDDFTSNQALFTRLIKFTALAPLVLQYVLVAETLGKPGAEKRQHVVDVITSTVDQLHKQGFVPAEMKENIAVTAGDIVDLIVGVHNANGVFEHSAPQRTDDNDYRKKRGGNR